MEDGRKYSNIRKEMTKFYFDMLINKMVEDNPIGDTIKKIKTDYFFYSKVYDCYVKINFSVGGQPMMDIYLEYDREQKAREKEKEERKERRIKKLHLQK